MERTIAPVIGEATPGLPAEPLHHIRPGELPGAGVDVAISEQLPAMVSDRESELPLAPSGSHKRGGPHRPVLRSRQAAATSLIRPSCYPIHTHCCASPNTR